MERYRVSRISFITLFLTGAFLLTLTFFLIRDRAYLLGAAFAILAIVCLFSGARYLRMRRINFKGHKILWSEIESIDNFAPDQVRTANSVIRPKVSAYYDIRTRFNKPYAMPAYPISWVMIEHSSKFHDGIIDYWEQYKNRGNQ
jgi:hypothetical protein